MSKDYSFIVCLDRGNAPQCQYCPHSKPHAHGSKDCLERVCPHAWAYVWCRPTKSRPQRVEARAGGLRVYRAYVQRVSIQVARAYVAKGLDLAEIDTTLTPHEQRAELQVKASGGRWWQL